MRSQLLGIPTPFYVLLAVAALAMIVIRRTVYGRTLLAVGQSRQAAHLAGIDVDRTVLVVFMISGGLAGLTGPLLAASVGSADLELGNPYLLASVGAVVLGGNQIAGGTATVRRHDVRRDPADPARRGGDHGGPADRISEHRARGGDHPRPGRGQRAGDVGCRDAAYAICARLVARRHPRNGLLAWADAEPHRGRRMTASIGDYGLDRDWTADVVGYPDPAIEVCDPRFERCRLLPASIERLWTGGRWTEGPAWFGDARCLLFSDIPNERILSWSEVTGAVTVYRSPSGFANGNTRDRQGRLITCEQAADA